MFELLLMMLNLYSHETHEIKFMPPLPKDYQKIYSGYKNVNLVTGRTPHMCLYEAHRVVREDTLYNISGESPNAECVLKAIKYRDADADSWEYPSGRVTCDRTNDNVQFMEWQGDSCLMPLPIQSVRAWQTAINLVYKRCLKKLVKDIPIMCFQEVDSSNFAMLKSLQSSNLNLKLYTDLNDDSGPASESYSSCHDRGLAILFDSSKLKFLSYHQFYTAGELPCVQALSFKYHGIPVCLCNIHMLVHNHAESYLLNLLRELKGYYPHIEVFVMAGDMNMRTRMTDESWTANCKIKDDSLDHILAHSVSPAMTLTLTPMSSVVARIIKCTKKGSEIKKSLNAIEKRLRKVNGGGHLVDKENFKHWVSDHEPIVAALAFKRTTL